MDEATAGERVARVEQLLGELEERGDTAALEVVGGLLELYGEGLARIVGQLGDGACEDLVGDELIAHLLLLHGLHPVDPDTRVKAALDEVRPRLASHGGTAELLGIDDGVARIRLTGSCDGCGSSATALRGVVEEAIYKAAPDIDEVDVEGAPSEGNGLSITMAGGDPAQDAKATAQNKPLVPEGAKGLPLAGQPQPPVAVVETGDDWKVAGTLSQLSGGGLVLKRIEDKPVLFVSLDGRYFAYRHLCPSCGGSLEDAQLAESQLECPSCNRRYDIRREGRCAEAPSIRLEPLPLQVAESGIVKVAAAS